MSQEITDYLGFFCKKICHSHNLVTLLAMSQNLSVYYPTAHKWVKEVVYLVLLHYSMIRMKGSAR